MSFQTPFNFFIHEPLMHLDWSSLNMQRTKRHHKEMLYYWNRVYYCCLDNHNNCFYSVSFSFNAHGAVFSQTYHKEVRITVMVKVRGTPTRADFSGLILSTIYTFTLNHK